MFINFDIFKRWFAMVVAGLGVVATTTRRIRNIGNIHVALASLGTSAVHVAGTMYRSEVWLPANKVITGISVLNGATAATDNLQVSLYDATGALVAQSAATLATGANAFQDIPFTTPYSAKGPALYIVQVQANGTTTTTRRIAAGTSGLMAASAAGSFGTIPATITPPTTFTADVGPIVDLY